MKYRITSTYIFSRFIVSAPSCSVKDIVNKQLIKNKQLPFYDAASLWSGFPISIEPSHYIFANTQQCFNSINEKIIRYYVSAYCQIRL